jgi:pre-mRNA cleavage complex 2 protein Pcf11
MQDKVKINSLSMVAEDHAESSHNAGEIYKVIRQRLVSKSVSRDQKLPLVYVVDSILKNVKGKFVPIIEKDAKEWMTIVYQVLPEDKRAKLKKVWNLWKDSGVFQESSWKEMGSCFSSSSSGDASQSSGPVVNSKLDKAGISWGVRVKIVWNELPLVQFSLPLFYVFMLLIILLCLSCMNRKMEA